jgi:hypothetical protein
MNSQLQSLSDQIFEIKEKCTDSEYKQLMDTVGNLYNSQQSTKSDIEDEEDIDRFIIYQATLLFDKPLRGTKEWIDSPVEDKAKWCNKTVEQFKKDDNDKPHWMEIEYYKKNPKCIPDYLKDNKLLKKRNNCDYCVIS